MTTTAPNARKRAGARARDRAPKPRKLRPFIAVDGEAVDGRYVLMRATSGERLQRAEGISTREAIEWLVNLASAHEAIFVGFAFSYDVNMILRDVDPETLKTIWKEGESQWEEYWIEWIPGKLFIVTAYEPKRYQFKLYDTFGFFQSSFVKALETWEIGSDDFLEGMKAGRSDFAWDDIEEIAAYCLHECELLTELMGAVRSALHDVDLFPRTWLGAGAIASTLMTREKVDTFLPKRDERRPPAIEDAILRAYFGGRTELFQQGSIGDVVARDINSAYPAEAVGLPSMLGEWKRARSYDPAAPWAIWRVKWDLPDDMILGPFPFRHKRQITYPLNGEGYYHAVEVSAARSLYPEGIEVTSGYVFTPRTDEKPFGFLPEVYEQRRKLKAEGHAGEKVLKLGINSVYGKLAQGTSRSGITPRFQDYFWAGRVTAGTRAKVLRACGQCPSAVVGIATDGIMFSGGEPDLEESSELGGWERSELSHFFIGQPGMYWALQSDGKPLVHSRGFFTKELFWPALVEAWNNEGEFGVSECPSHRFVGLGSALVRRDFSIWRTWVDSTRTIRLYSSRKFYEAEDEGESVRRLYPPTAETGGLSERYVPKGGAIELDEENAEWIAGMEQPLIS